MQSSKPLYAKANQKVLIKIILDFSAFLFGHRMWQGFLKWTQYQKQEGMKTKEPSGFQIAGHFTVSRLNLQQLWEWKSRISIINTLKLRFRENKFTRVTQVVNGRPRISSH